MRRPPQHNTDQAAKRIFSEAIASWTQANELHEDYGIDFVVEIFDGDPSSQQIAAGHDFMVQLKGTQKIDERQHSVHFDFSVEHLAYYLDKKRVPVFLALVDVPGQVGYWLFLQKAAASLSSDWRTQKSVSISIPKSQLLHDKTAFRQAVVDAVRWMEEKWPGSPLAAVRKEAARLESIDPRMEATVNIVSGKVERHLHAKEPVAIELHVRGPEDKWRAFKNAIDLGEKVEPSKFGLDTKIYGSPLFDGKALSELKVGQEHQGTLSIVRKRSDSESSIEIPARILTGPGGLRCLATVGSGLLSISLTMERQPGPPYQTKLDWKCSASEWCGKNVFGHLNEFEKLQRVFSDPQQDDVYLIDVSTSDGPLFGVQMSGAFGNDCIRHMGFVEVVRRIRELFGGQTEPLILCAMSDEEAIKLEQIWLLSHGKSIQLGANHIHFTVQVPREAWSSVVGLHGAKGSILIPWQEHVVELWGRSFRFDCLVCEINDASLALEAIYDVTDLPYLSARVSVVGSHIVNIRPPASNEERKRCNYVVAPDPA